MKTAAIVRIETGEQGTFGVLAFGNVICHSLELPWRENRKRLSCIPNGTYNCALVKSPKFGRVYGVQSVKDRSHVLIHSANLAGDVEAGYATQLHGCIAPFERMGKMQNGQGAMQKAGLVSSPALRKLMSWADGKPFSLEISWQS